MLKTELTAETIPQVSDEDIAWWLAGQEKECPTRQLRVRFNWPKKHRTLELRPVSLKAPRYPVWRRKCSCDCHQVDIADGDLCFGACAVCRGLHYVPPLQPEWRSLAEDMALEKGWSVHLSSNDVVVLHESGWKQSVGANITTNLMRALTLALLAEEVKP